MIKVLRVFFFLYSFLFCIEKCLKLKRKKDKWTRDNVKVVFKMLLEGKTTTRRDLLKLFTFQEKETSIILLATFIKIYKKFMSRLNVFLLITELKKFYYIELKILSRCPVLDDNFCTSQITTFLFMRIINLYDKI